MRSAITRSRLLGSLVLAAILLAGCGNGPASVGAAAFVGDSRIPVNEVQARFRTVLDKEPAAKQQLDQQGQLGEFGRRLATDLVRRRLVEQATRDEGLRVDERQLTELINAAGGPEKASAGQIYTPADFRDAMRSRLLTGELGRKYIDRIGVTYDVTSATNRREAEDKARRMSHSDQESAAVVAADRQAGVGAATGEHLRSAEVPELAAATPLFGALPGTTMAFELQPQSGQWTVVRIKQRSTEERAAPSGAGADEAKMQAVGAQLLRVTAQRIGVELSPRYGVWDEIALSAAPSAGETIGIAFQPRRA